jgi:CheY-like chemotaxis protein
MRHTVLVVEDETELRELMREALEDEGYTVVAAPDGRAALDAASHIDKICLVLLDLLMPIMNGWDFLDEARKRPEFSGVPVIVHTSAPNSAPSGVAKVLQKPLQLDRLLATVHDYCAQ